MASLTAVIPGADTPATTSLRRALLSTDASLTSAFQRIALAGVLLPHGAQHLFGAFGGYGLTGTTAWMTGTLGIPAPLAVAGILLEFFGPILLIAGLASRLAAAGLAVFMAVAASTHLGHGFFMNWFGTLPAGAEGFEFHLLAIALAVAIAVNGSGACSLDRLLTRREQVSRG
jgi:putative oxidoreductase